MDYLKLKAYTSNITNSFILLILSQKYQYKKTIYKKNLYILIIWYNDVLYVNNKRYIKYSDLNDCKICNVIDDEYHFFLNCKINDTLRNNFYLDFTDQNFIFLNKSKTEKLVKILNPSTPKQIKTVAYFIEESL